MEEIDYSKWYDCDFCPRCIKELTFRDWKPREDNITLTNGHKHNIKSLCCKKCGSHCVSYPSPTAMIYKSVGIVIFMTGVFGFLWMFADNTSTLSVTMAVITMCICTGGLISLNFKSRAKAALVIEKIEKIERRKKLPTI